MASTGNTASAPSGMRAPVMIGAAAPRGSGAGTHPRGDRGDDAQRRSGIGGPHGEAVHLAVVERRQRDRRADGPSEHAVALPRPGVGSEVVDEPSLQVGARRRQDPRKQQTPATPAPPAHAPRRGAERSFARGPPNGSSCSAWASRISSVSSAPHAPTTIRRTRGERPTAARRNRDHRCDRGLRPLRALRTRHRRRDRRPHAVRVDLVPDHDRDDGGRSVSRSSPGTAVRTRSRRT